MGKRWSRISISHLQKLSKNIMVYGAWKQKNLLLPTESQFNEK